MEIIEDREQNKGWRVQRIGSRIEDGDYRGQGVEQKMELLEDMEQTEFGDYRGQGVEQRMEIIEDREQNRKGRLQRKGSRIEDGD